MLLLMELERSDYSKDSYDYNGNPMNGTTKLFKPAYSNLYNYN